MSFGQVNSVRLNVNVREAHSTLLDVLSEQHEQHQDLFNSNRLTFSEALAKLYQRLNPQIDMKPAYAANHRRGVAGLPQLSGNGS